MPSYNQAQLNYKVQSGNTVICMIGDVTVAFAQVVSQSIDLGAEFLRGIGTAKPQEIQQLVFSPTIAVDSFQLTDQGISTLQIPANLAQLLANNSFDIHVISADGTILLSFIGCVGNTFNANVPVNSIITQAITFFAMDVLGEDGTSILNGPFALQNVAALSSEGIALNTIGL